MSFQYGQFGTGFMRSLPSREAQQFRDMVETRGEDVTVVLLTETGEDDYGNPVYSESCYTEKAFVEGQVKEKTTQAGYLKLGSLRLFVVPWAAVREEACEVEVDGLRYHIKGIEETKACLEVEAEREAE